MAISRIGAVCAASTSLTPTIGLAMDIMVAHAYRTSAATVPTLPSGWTSLGSQSGNTTAGLLAYKVCTGTSDTATGFTGATQLTVGKYRGVLGIGFVATSNATGTSISYPTGTLIQSAGQSWVVGFAGHRTATNVGSVAPSGMTAVSGGNLGASSVVGMFDTNAGVTSWAGGSATVNASSGHQSFTLELLGANSTFNPYAKAAPITLSAANLTATCSGAAADASVYGSFPRTGGKYVFSFTYTNIQAFGPTIGFSSTPGAVNRYAGNLWIATGGDDAGTDVGLWDGNGGTGSATVMANNVALVATGMGTPANGVTAYCARDIPNGLSWFKVGAGNWNGSGTANPDTGTGGLSDGIGTGLIYPIFSSFQIGAGTYSGTGAASAAGLTTFNDWDPSSGTSVTLTGQSMTASQGTVALSGGVGISGQAMTAGQGAVTPGISGGVTLAGQSMTAGQGAVSPAAGAGVTLTGLSMTSGQGPIALAIARNVTLTGQSMSLSQGTIVPTVIVLLSGQAMTAGQGSVGLSIARNVTLTGQSMTAGIGAIGKSISAGVTLVGQTMAMGQGIVIKSIPGGVTLVGQPMTISHGVLGIAKTISISGQHMTAQQGTVVPVRVSGVTIVGQSMSMGQGHPVVRYLPGRFEYIPVRAENPERSVGDRDVVYVYVPVEERVINVLAEGRILGVS